MNFSAPLQVKQSLRMLGFSDNESKILLVLFREKKASTLEISKKSATSFSTTQYLLDNLVKRKIIHPSSKKDDIFEILSENELQEWIGEQKKTNESIYNKASSDISSFLTNIISDSWRPEVLYFEGNEGIKQIYSDVIECGEDVYSWLDINQIIPVVGDYLDIYIQKRKEKGMMSHAIMPKTKGNTERAHGDENRKVKYTDHLNIDGEIRIYGNNVAVITFDGKKPVGFVFRGEIITRIFRAIFENSWKSLD